MIAVRRSHTRNAIRGPSNPFSSLGIRASTLFCADDRSNTRVSLARSAGTSAALRQSGWPSGRMTLQLSRHSSSTTNPAVSWGSEASARSIVLARSAGRTFEPGNSTSSTSTFGKRAWNVARIEVRCGVAASLSARSAIAPSVPAQRAARARWLPPPHRVCSAPRPGTRRRPTSARQADAVLWQTG